MPAGNPGLHQSVGHLVPQADTCGQSLIFIDAAKVQTIQVAVPSEGRASALPPPSPCPEGQPNGPWPSTISRVLLGPQFHKGLPPPVLASTEYSQKTGKPENQGTTRPCAKYVNYLTM